MKPWMLYLVLGVVFALLCDWRLQESSRRERIVNALLSVCAWPLFAPLVMLPGLARRAERESDASLRVKRALAEARAAVVGTPLAKLVPETMLSRLMLTLAELDARRTELSELLARPDFRRDPAGGARGSQHKASVARLWAILERDRAAMDELVELAEALRTQLLLARYSGRSGRTLAGPGVASPALTGELSDLALELSARVESLNAWFELDPPHSRVAASPEETDTRVCPRC